MKLEYKQINNTLYFGLSGELDEKTAANVRTSIDDILEKSNAVKIVFELSQLQFMDSTGIGVLIGRYKKMKNKGAKIYISSPSKSVDKILSLSGLYEIMPLIEF